MSHSSRSIRAAVCAAASLAIVATSCAPAPAPAGASPGRPSERSTGVLTWEEVDRAQLGSGQIVDAIRHLRPGFLVPRGGADRGGEQADIQVSINDGIPGSMTMLHDLPARAVATVMLLSPGDALLRFGMRESLGPVLVVRLK